MPFLKRLAKLLLNKPGRIVPHIRTMGAYWGANLFQGYANYPQTIYLGISNKCNLQCKMCDFGQKSDSFYKNFLAPKNELLFSDWKNFIDEVARFNPRIELCSAEPLLYKDLTPLLEYLKKKKLSCGIFTNGFFLKEFSKVIIDNNVSALYVSIDGPPEIHDRIRGKPGSFDRAVEGLLKLKSYSEEKLPTIDINYTVSQYNYSNIIDTFELLKKYKLDFINKFTITQTLFVPKETADLHNSLFPEFPMTTICGEGVNFSEIDTTILSSQIKKLTGEFPNKVRMYPAFDLKFLNDWYLKPDQFIINKRCLFIWNSACVISDGSIIPSLRCIGTSFGNIREKGFLNIWNDKEFRKFRLLSKKTGLFPICARCSASFMK